MCRNVTPQTTTSGVLLVGQRVVYYVADEAVMDDNYTQVNVIESNHLLVANIPSMLKFNKKTLTLKVVIIILTTAP